MSLLDSVRARAHAALEKVPGRVGARLRDVNEKLGRPFADAGELDERRAFVTRVAPAAAAPQAAPATTAAQAPVIVFYMEKQKRDVGKLTDILDAHGVKYTVTNIQEDAAAQYAVRRDSHGVRLPVVFVAGDCIGGRQELVNAASSGELKKKVFGS